MGISRNRTVRTWSALVAGLALAAGVSTGVGDADAATKASKKAKSRRVNVRSPKIPSTTLLTTPSSTTPSTPGTGAEKPGTLISSELLKNPPFATTGYLVRYRSTSAAGKPIEVTGVAYIPKGRAPVGGWPTLSYAHGTVGLADRCTPSKNISALETTVAGTLAAAGIAVVASDFEGLGTPGRHPYLVGISEGRGVLDIVKAARQIPNANLSNRFITWGHSQGGHASLFAGELASTWAPELKLLGVIAGAPPSQLTNVGDAVQDSPFRGYVFMVAAGLHAANPSLDLSAVLTPKAQKILPVVDEGCNQAVFNAFAKDPYEDLIIRKGLENGPWKAALAENEPGQAKTDAPILIIHGDRDEQIPIETSATLKKKLCANGSTVERRVYEGQDHGGAALVSLFEVAAWIAERVADVPATNKC
jgi:pimeloyl-ACP methyl ester carboxylesterase